MKPGQCVRSEQQADQLRADGVLTDEDAHAVHTFALYLRERAAPRATGEQRRAWRARWGPYEQGEADGPTANTTTGGDG